MQADSLRDIYELALENDAQIKAEEAVYLARRETENLARSALLPQVAGHDPASSIVTTLAQEKTFNTFFRLSSPSVIAQLRESFSDLPEQPDPKTVFVKLRELRNRW